MAKKEIIARLASEAAEEYVTSLPAWVRKGGWGPMETSMLELVIAETLKRAIQSDRKRNNTKTRKSRFFH